MILGVTGGIATGKSSVAEQFRRRGAPVVSADELARQAVLPGTAGLLAIIERFGRSVLTENGELDREQLARLIFADDSARRDLNRITHPAIARLAEKRLAELVESGAGLIIYEAPLLFEAGSESRVDKVLVVTATFEAQRKRLMQRDQIGAAEAEARIAAQMPLAEKVERADYIIDNSGTPEQTAARVDALWRDLLRTVSP